MAMYPDNYAEEVKKAFEQQARDMQFMYVQVLRLRYFTGTIHMREFIDAVKHLSKLSGKEISDLDLTEQIEELNKERDAFYKRVIDGAKANETPA